MSMPCVTPQKTHSKRLNKDDKTIVRIILRYEKQPLLSVYKNAKDCVVLTFPTIIYITNKYGFVDEVWQWEDCKWVSMGSESNLY